MNKNRVILLLGVISLLSISMAVSTFRNKSFASNVEETSDFYQRHPYWIWSIRGPALASSDYFQRHPELSAPATLRLNASDYFQRHSELIAPAEVSADLTDYHFRQLAQKKYGPDLSDYYFRHVAS